jgi:hypothetical protein
METPIYWNSRSKNQQKSARSRPTATKVLVDSFPMVYWPANAGFHGG